MANLNRVRGVQETSDVMPTVFVFFSFTNTDAWRYGANSWLAKTGGGSRLAALQTLKGISRCDDARRGLVKRS